MNETPIRFPRREPLERAARRPVAGGPDDHQLALRVIGEEPLAVFAEPRGAFPAREKADVRHRVQRARFSCRDGRA